NFGPGRPGGQDEPFDSGTSAATPCVCGVAAMLLSAFPNLTPAALADVLRQTAVNIGQPGWDADTGFGVVNAGAAYTQLRTAPPTAVPRPAPLAPDDRRESEPEEEPGHGASRRPRRSRAHR